MCKAAATVPQPRVMLLPGCCLVGAADGYSLTDNTPSGCAKREPTLRATAPGDVSLDRRDLTPLPGPMSMDKGLRKVSDGKRAASGERRATECKVPSTEYRVPSNVCAC